MSLEVYTTNINGTRDVETIWTDSKFTQCKPIDVYEVFADGDELKRALQISGLPQYGTVMCFFGDTAKHIVGNWFN